MYKVFKNHLIYITIIVVLISLINCSGPGVSGATSETTNGQVSSVVINEDGFAVSNADVFVYKEDALRFLDDSNIEASAKTDSNGFFTIDSLDSVNYNIEIVDSMGYRAQVFVTFDSLTGLHEINDVEQIQLRQAGRLYGTVEHNSFERVYVQAYGLHRIVEADTSGYFVFTDLPHGGITIKILTDSGIVVEDKDTFEVKTSESTNCGQYSTGSTLENETAIIRNFLDVNGLTHVGVDSVAFGSPRHYFYVYCDNFDIDTLTPGIFDLRLKHLSLAGNDLDYLPEEIGKLATLTYLDISQNDIHSLPESIGFLESMEELDMGSNDLTELPESILNLENIQELYVNDNKLHDLPSYIRTWVDKFSKDPYWEYTQR